MFCLQTTHFTTLEKKYKQQGYFKQGNYKNKGDYKIIARKLSDELHLNVIGHIIIKATITQMGTPTIFWTLSMADFHWPDIHDLFSSNDESESADFRQNIIDNPHIVDWFVPF